MRVVRDLYGRRFLLNADQTPGLPDIAMPWVHQEKKDGAWKLWGWHLVYGRASIHVDHGTAQDLMGDAHRVGVDIALFVRGLLAEMNAPPEGAKPTTTAN